MAAQLADGGSIWRPSVVSQFPLLQNVEKLATADPEHLALVDGGVAYTYGELQTSITSLSAELTTVLQEVANRWYKIDFCPHVAFLMQPGPLFAAVELAIWRCGAVAVPLSLASPPNELAYFLDDACASVLLADEFQEDKLRQARETLIQRQDERSSSAGSAIRATALCLVKAAPNRSLALQRVAVGPVIFTGDDAGAADPCTSPALPPTSAPPDHPSPNALILYTSGTTGKPKGVVHTVASLSAQHFSLQQAWQWTKTDRTLHVLPLHHIHGLQNVLNTCLYAGACVEFLQRELIFQIPFAPTRLSSWFLGKFDPEKCLKRLGSGQITCFHAVPTVYTKMMQHLDNDKVVRADEKRRMVAGLKKVSVEGGPLRLMVCGSAALPVPTMVAWAELSGQILLERYGMTEIGMGLSNSYEGRRYPGCVGRPLPLVEVKIAPLENEAEDKILLGNRRVSPTS